jgi:hypothetical protein
VHDPLARPPGTLVRRSAAALTAMLLALSTAACTGDDEPAAEPSPSASTSQGATATLEPRPAPARVRVTRVAGRMRPKDRDVLADNVGKVVTAYFEDAFLGGDQPRTRFDDGFATFTRDAARSARRQQRLTTNAALGPDAEAVVARRQRAFLSVLAPKGVATGVTARVDLAYLVQRSEGADRLVTVRGRLLLTRAPSGGWKIFGYDLTRGARAAGEGA